MAALPVVSNHALVTTPASIAPFVAGPVAEAIYSGARLPDLIADNVTEIDVDTAEDALDRDGGSLSFDVALAATQRVVEQEWPRIKRVAAELLRRHRLDYHECRQIVGK